MNARDRPEQERVVTDQKIGLPPMRLGDHCFRHIERDKNPAHLGVRIPALQPDVVPLPGDLPREPMTRSGPVCHRTFISSNRRKRIKKVPLAGGTLLCFSQYC